MKTNPYITLEEIPNDAEFLEGVYIVRLFDDNGFQYTKTITKHDMVDDPILFHYINSKTAIDFTDFDAVSDHVMNKGLTSKLDIYNMIETLFYRYMKSHECVVEWEKKEYLYKSLRNDIEKYVVDRGE